MDKYPECSTCVNRYGADECDECDDADMYEDEEDGEDMTIEEFKEWWHEEAA